MVFIIIIAIIFVVWLVMKGLSTKASAEMAQDPAFQQHILQPLERWGRWDGSPEQSRKADEAFSRIANYIGTGSYQTRTLYDDTLRHRPFLIPLCAAYAFAVEEFLNNPWFQSDQGNSPEINQKVTMMHLLFPGYAQFVDQKHSRKDAEAVLCITMNLLDLFLQ